MRDLAVDDALHLEAQRGGRALLDHAEAEIDVALGAGWRSCTSRSSSISTPRPAASTFTTPPHASDSTPGQQQQRLRVERLAEAHRVEQHGRLRVGRVVHDLHHAHLVDVLARAGEHERQQVVRPTRVDARREARRVARAARGFERLAHAGRDVRRVDHRHDRARHDVLARREDALEVLHRLAGPQVGGRGVAHAVGVEREQRVDVVGREHAVGREPGQLARVPARPCRASAPTARRARDRGAARCSAARALPTLPVLHWMTRYVMRVSRPRSRLRSSLRGGAR